MKDERFTKQLESLIRAHVRVALGPVRLKMPVLGGEGVAFGSTSISDVEVVEVHMESGLLWLPDVPTYNLDVYTGTVIADYIAVAQGTDIPHSDPFKSEYLNGLAVSDTACFDWPDAWSPTITAGKYTSALQDSNQAFADDINNSSIYTGEMRLAVQAKVGAKRSPDELVPVAWGGIDPDKDGLFRTADYTFFVVRIDAGGCSAARLTTDMECVRAWLAEHESGALLMPDADVPRFEAYLLATAEVEKDLGGSEVVFELLTAGDLISVYDGRAPLCYGWHYSYEGLTEASVVTWREGDGSSLSEYYWETTLARIDFTFLKNVYDEWEPDATLQIEHQDSYLTLKLPQNLLWYAQDSLGVTCLKKPPTGVVINTAINIAAPAYVFYTKNRGRQELTYLFNTTEPEALSAITEQEFPFICGDGESSFSKRIHEGATTTSGFILSDGTQANKKFPVLYTDREMFMQAATAGAEDGAPGDTTSCNFIGMCGGTVPECTNALKVSSNWDIRTASASAFIEDSAVTQADGRHVAIIPLDSPEAVYLLESETGEEEISRADYLPGVAGTLQAVNGLKSKEAGGEVSGGVIMYNFHQEYWFEAGGYTNRLASQGWNVISTNNFQRMHSAQLATANAVYACSMSYPDWQTFSVVPSEVCTRPGLIVEESYGGDCIFYDSPSTQAIEGGYSGAVLDSFDHRWLGWS